MQGYRLTLRLHTKKVNSVRLKLEPCSGSTHRRHTTGGSNSTHAPAPPKAGTLQVAQTRPTLRLYTKKAHSGWLRLNYRSGSTESRHIPGGSCSCGELHLILGLRIDDLSDFMKYSRARGNGQSRREPASRASRVYLSPTIVPSLPL